MKIEEVYTRDPITGVEVKLSDILREYEERIETLEQELLVATNSLFELASEFDEKFPP